MNSRGVHCYRGYMLSKCVEFNCHFSYTREIMYGFTQKQLKNTKQRNSKRNP